MRELRCAGWREDTQQGTLATGVARDCGDVGSVAGWPSGREWNGLQPGQGATELGFPRPAPGEMQSEAARRAIADSKQLNVEVLNVERGQWEQTQSLAVRR